MRALAQPELIARLDVALRAAAPDLAGQGRRPVAVEATPSGELRMTTDGPALPGNGPWRLDVDGVTWVLAARLDLEDLAVDARGSMTPCPALAHVGATPTGQLFVDLEAIGLLLVDLPEPLATDVVRCLAASVALSPLAGSSQVVLVGMPADRFVAAATILDEAASLDAALELAAAALGTTPTAARSTSTFDLRARGIGGEAWEPAVVFVTGDTGAEALDAARRAAGDGLAVVTVARGCDAEWRIEARRRLRRHRAARADADAVRSRCRRAGRHPCPRRRRGDAVGAARPGGPAAVGRGARSAARRGTGAGRARHGR